MARFLRCGYTRSQTTKFFLIFGLLCLSYVFLRRFGYITPVSSQILRFESGIESQLRLGGSNPSGGLSDNNLIEARIKQMTDYRSGQCKSESHNGIKESVSIVLDFYDYQYYNLKTTLASILHYGAERINEIIVVDDGSTLQYIVDECTEYLANIPGVKLLRHRVQTGQLRSRLDGYAQARSDIVVFLDVNVVVSKGWLNPLIDLLTQYPSTLAMPHFDQIHDPITMEYQPTPVSLVATWGWNLAVRMRKSIDPRISDSSRYIMSPALHGTAFAARKSFLDKLGGLDGGMEDGGGEYLDLTLKAWLCEGSIMIASCSRVGLLNLYSPIKVKSPYNTMHLARTYLAGWAAPTLRLNAITENSQAPRRDPSGLDLTKCRTIEWYLKEVKNDTHPPSTDAIYHGILRSQSGGCARSNPDGKIDLIPCPEMDPNFLPIELTLAGRLRLSDGRCLTTANNAYILATSCRGNDTAQEWKYSDRFELVNIWSGYCARHVTDPDQTGPASRQIAMSQDCNVGGREARSFKEWIFIGS